MPYAFKWTNPWSQREVMVITDGSPEFWEVHGDGVTIVFWGCDG